MSWINQYQLVLLDLDGLLVNTEKTHFQAYKKALSKRGIVLDWDFKKYCSLAHYTSEGVKLKIFQEHPELGTEKSWKEVYADKKAAMMELLYEEEIPLMPGVKDFLTLLQKASIPCCVVTHSSNELVHIIRQKNRLFDIIPYWIARENYSFPKPNPECYLKAIEAYALPGTKVIGFEDTPRGIKALLKTRATPVLISEIPYPEIPSFLTQGVLHFPSFISFAKMHPF